MQYEIQKLSLGGILDQAIKLLQNHFKALFGIVLVLYVPYAVIQSLATGSGKAHPAFGVMTFVFGLILVLFVWPLTNAAMILAISEFYLGRSITAGAALKRALKFVRPLIVLSILYGLAVLGGLICLVIPGIYLIFRLYFYTQVLVIEGKDARPFARSGVLMKGNFGTAFILGFLIWIITMALSFVVGALPGAILSTVAGALVSGVMVLFGAAAGVVFYFSARCQHENFDLEVLADSIGRTAPGNEPLPTSEA
ncbi:MAG: hypothetical protein M1457_04330 [bacterium]|nr:hypothetical protein [bacterium]